MIESFKKLIIPIIPCSIFIILNPSSKRYNIDMYYICNTLTSLKIILFTMLCTLIIYNYIHNLQLILH